MALPVNGLSWAGAAYHMRIHRQNFHPAARCGWRFWGRFLNCFHGRTYRDAAARICIDATTVRRWRAKYEGFRNRCDDIAAEHYRQQNADEVPRRGRGGVKNAALDVTSPLCTLRT